MTTINGTSGDDTEVGTASNDTIYGGAGNDTLSGEGGDDRIEGGTDNDVAYGGDGYDRVFGGDGDDQIYGGSDTTYDDLYGGAGNDEIHASDGSENWIYGGSGDDTVYGGANEDLVDGGSGNDTLQGNGGADYIEGGVGDDEIYGGAGNDTIRGEQDDDTLYGGAGDDTFEFADPSGHDTTFGGEGHDRVRFLSSSDVSISYTADQVATYSQNGGTSTGTFTEIEQIETFGGNDQIDGAALTGDMSIYSGSGNDVITSGSGDDVVTSTSGNNTISTGAGNDYIATGAGNDSIRGEDGDDTIYGGDGDDRLDGGAGNDLVYGGAGHDVLHGGSGDDHLDAGSGNDTIYNGSGNDTVFGNAGDDKIFDGAGNDTLYGGTGNDVFEVDEAGDSDTIYGGENAGDADIVDFSTTASTDGVVVTFTGEEAANFELTNTTTSGRFEEIEKLTLTDNNDTVDASAVWDGTFGDNPGVRVDAGAGDDTFLGGNGSDTVFGGDGDDSLNGDYGDDTLHGDAGNDSLVGERGNDELFGGAGNDALFGGIEGDTLSGGSGSDTINGGEGNDVLSGGSGDDTFDLDQGSGDDVILDFDIGDSDGDGKYNDQFDVAGLQNPDGSPVKASDVTVEDDGSGNARLIFPEGESVVLQGVTPAQMSSASQLNAAGIPCFTPGAMIATPDGERAIETLQVGDKVMTRDHGMQPIRWIGQRAVKGHDLFAPVMIQPGVVTGLHQPLLVSPQHRMLFTGYRAELLFGESEVLVAAKHLIDGRSVTQDVVDEVIYIHLLFDTHEVIYANGAATESFHPGEEGIAAVDHAGRDELFAIFPELRSDLNQYGQTARRCLRRHEAQMVRM